MTGASSGATRIGSTAPQALEFFAGIGLARLGLEEAGFHVAWSNDIDHAKCQMYRNQFGNNEQEHTLIEGIWVSYMALTCLTISPLLGAPPLVPIYLWLEPVQG